MQKHPARSAGTLDKRQCDFLQRMNLFRHGISQIYDEAVNKFLYLGQILYNHSDIWNWRFKCPLNPPPR